MDATGLTIFLTLDIVGSIALAAWLGAQRGGSGWDR